MEQYHPPPAKIIRIVENSAEPNAQQSQVEAQEAHCSGNGKGASQENLDEEADTKKSGKKRRSSHLDWLECPVCLEIPRGQIHQCHNGHILCQSCQPKLTSCPVCRDSDLGGRSLVAERLLETTEIPCRFGVFGCDKEDLPRNLEIHERACYYRSVPCPAHHRNACPWSGPLSQLLKHVIAEKCAQVVKEKCFYRPFSSTIGDFHQANMSVFDRPNVTHWKPVLLISPSSIRYFVYIIIFRDQSGQWSVTARSYADEEIVKSLEVEISFRQVKRNRAIPVHSMTYVGGVAPANMSDAECEASGQYFLMKDAQVKRFSNEKTILDYTVKLRRIAKRNPTGEPYTEEVHPNSQTTCDCQTCRPRPVLVAS